MNPPIRYRYDPRWEMVALFWVLAAGLLLLAFAGLFSRLLGIAASVGFASFGVLMTLRRHAFRRSLVLDEEGVWLPSGFLRMNVRRICFTQVSAVWEAFLPCMAVLCLRSHGKTYEVVSTLLPDHESYLAVGRFICSRTKTPYI